MIASFTSIKFNYYLMQEKYEGPKEENIKKKVDHMEAIFDGRLFALPKESDAVANLLWRQDWDCKRNSISMLAQKHFKPKEIHACSCATMKVMLKERKNIVWEDMPDHFKMGTFAKRGIVEVEGFNPRTKEKCWAKRKKVVTRTFELLKYNGGQEVDQGKLIFAKTWDEVDDLADEYKASTASDNTANVPTSDTTTSVPTSGTTTTATDDLPTETATGIIADTTPALAVAAAAQAISATDIAQADVASDVKRSSDTEDAAGEAVKKVKTRTDT
ncbi:hypothetical protein SARC_04664 [Sphaeroforma arctica JP610]|uniref:Uncharacterized protein n=1 Tax=Sphaeroforma arctica JP610 TaxID=667725 RepID=A0A0L0G2Q0_9EUKA|nr:hypothetical protein SARC_04664 [Sphaeroforma arctica JP610]KNC83071.1 hypothetical protein SARC_04664 [Sphaeroforma arctica JP610]|eukprot:XP_014156973.1 hypothetical protein SARC_04664 [Sphaeroforma arctica JP610]